MLISICFTLNFKKLTIQALLYGYKQLISFDLRLNLLKRIFSFCCQGFKVFSRFQIINRSSIIQQAGIDAFDVIGAWYLVLVRATEKGLIPDAFQISKFDKEMIKKGKLLSKKWFEEWEDYKSVEKEMDNAKDILGF